VEKCVGRFEIRAGNGVIVQLATSYSEMTKSDLFAIAGSSGYLELSVNKGAAAGILNCTAGVLIHLKEY
jgi:S-adenosylmethionine hydrolase